jgi:hypothetical protein
MLEFIARLRACSEYQVDQIAVNTDDLGWSTMAVTVQELRLGPEVVNCRSVSFRHGGEFGSS